MFFHPTKHTHQPQRHLLDGCRLTYFAIPGRGEATRLALAIGGFAFDDHRISTDVWPSLKPKTPWGSLPLLRFSDGMEVAQQRSILRLVGKEAGLYPTRHDHTVQACLIDSVMDVCEDVIDKVNAQGQGLPTEEKEKARCAAVSKGGVVYDILKKIEDFVKHHGCNGHAIGNAMTVADLSIFSSCGTLVSGVIDGVPTDALEHDDFKRINAIRKAVRKHPAVQKFYKELDVKWREQMPPSFGPFE